MQREEVTRMALEAGFREDVFSGGPRKGKVSIFDYGDVDIFDNLKRFASLVAAAERERAAKVCEVDWDSETKSMGKYFAAAIRALT